MRFSANPSLPCKEILRIADGYRAVKRSANAMLETEGDGRSVKNPLTQSPKELKKTQQVPVAHRIPEPGKPGSLAAIAQLVEQQVAGSNPASSSINYHEKYKTYWGHLIWKKFALGFWK